MSCDTALLSWVGSLSECIGFLVTSGSDKETAIVSVDGGMVAG